MKLSADMSYGILTYKEKLKAEKSEAQREAMETLQANEKLIELMKEERERNKINHMQEHERLTAEISRLSSMCRRLKEFINSPTEKGGA